MSSALKFPFVFWPQTPPKLSFTCCLIAKNEIRQDENQPYKVITGTEHGLCVMWHFLKVKTLQENNKKLVPFFILLVNFFVNLFIIIENSN